MDPVIAGMTSFEKVLIEEQAREMLIEAHELLSDGWSQDARGQGRARPIEPASVFARAWSLGGALERVWRRSGLHRETASTRTWGRTWR